MAVFAFTEVWMRKSVCTFPYSSATTPCPQLSGRGWTQGSKRAATAAEEEAMIAGDLNQFDSAWVRGRAGQTVVSCPERVEGWKRKSWPSLDSSLFLWFLAWRLIRRLLEADAAASRWHSVP